MKKSCRKDQPFTAATAGAFVYAHEGILTDTAAMVSVFILPDVRLCRSRIPVFQKRSDMLA